MNSDNADVDQMMSSWIDESDEADTIKVEKFKPQIEEEKLKSKPKKKAQKKNEEEEAKFQQSFPKASP